MSDDYYETTTELGAHYSHSGIAPPPSVGGTSSQRLANAQVCPPGMEYLISTSLVVVRQSVELLEAFTGIDTNNRYEILDAGGRRLYLAAEQSNCCVRIMCGSRRPFTILVLNNQGGICLKVIRKCGCCYCLCNGACCNVLEVYTGTDVFLGKVTQKLCDCFCPRFAVFDANGKKCLNIRGPCHMCLCCTVKFKVTDLDGNEIGQIQKKWGGIVKEMFTTADTFGVSFPIDMDPRLKTLLVGAVFLIDFMYFENQGSSSSHDH